MHPALRLPYAWTARLARAATRLAPEGPGKLRTALRERRDVADRFIAWAAVHRDRSRPLLWMHAPSVGEGLQARPVLERLRARHPEWQIAYTYFSPSARAFARNLDVDVADYLPFDTAEDAALLCTHLAPRALVFSKLDVWPTLVASAHERRVRLGMISATVSGVSSRDSTVARWLLRDAYQTLDRVGAVHADDAQRLGALGVRSSALGITGDTRYDQVWQRAECVDRDGPLLAPLAGSRTTLVAGSTWPADEVPLFAAWNKLTERRPNLRLIIAPHEPTAEHLERIEAQARRPGARVVRLGDADQRHADVIVVDRVGVLGDLYALADIAFVGGGFHRAGLHSVLEPAAFGSPVLFGPQHENARDAELLVRNGGGFVVTSARDFEERLGALAGDPHLRENAGRLARELVTGGLGAADRATALVEELMAE